MEAFYFEMGKSVLIKTLQKDDNLIGKNENEIKIEFNGLRKGEKLSEKLFFNEEKMIKTEINGILFTNEKLFKVDVSNYGNLNSLIMKNNTIGAMKKFKEMLPEYQINE